MPRTGFMYGKRSLSPASEVVRGGLYSPTTLSAVDSDLATGNIKNGITIFGKAGSADVHDISDATAIEAEVLDPETFYAVSGGIRTGTMPTVAITAVNDDYPEGYHVGNGGGLAAIDVNLAAANILSGVDIFGFVGPATVQDIANANAVVGGVKAGQTFYSITGARKTGTLATRTLSPDNETVLDGYYAATTLSAVDIHLAAANIKDGITIFGFLGTLSATQSEDLTATAISAIVAGNSTTTILCWYQVIHGATTDIDLATTTPNFDANSMAVGVGSLMTKVISTDATKLRVYLGGVLVAESGFMAINTYYVVCGTRALSGATECKVTAYNTTGGDVWFHAGCMMDLVEIPAGIGVGSIKV